MTTQGQGLVRVLLVWASPRNLENLRLAEEERIIRECLRYFEGSVVIETLPACQIADLHSKLTSQKYDMLHFGGHTDRTTKLVHLLLEKYCKPYSSLWPPKQGLKIDAKFVNVVDEMVNAMETDVYFHHGAAACVLSASSNSMPSNLPKTNKFPFLSSYVQDVGDVTDTSVSPPLLKTLACKSYNLKYCGNLLQSVATEGGPCVEIDEMFTYHDLLEMGVGSLCINNDPTSASYARINAIEFFRCLQTHQSGLKCVVLNACNSILAGALLSTIVPVTACVKGKLSDSESYNFAKGFYQSLSEGKTFTRASSECRNYFNLMNFSPGTPLRSLSLPTSSIIKVFFNKRLASECFAWSLKSISAAAFLRCNEDGKPGRSSQQLAKELELLQAEKELLQAENISLRQDKINMTRTIAEGTAYLQDTLKEMARLNNLVADLTSVGAQTFLQMKLVNGNTSKLPVALASSAQPRTRYSRNVAVARAVYVSKTPSKSLSTAQSSRSVINQSRPYPISTSALPQGTKVLRTALTKQQGLKLSDKDFIPSRTPLNRNVVPSAEPCAKPSRIPDVRSVRKSISGLPAAASGKKKLESKQMPDALMETITPSDEQDNALRTFPAAMLPIPVCTAFGIDEMVGAPVAASECSGSVNNESLGSTGISTATSRSRQSSVLLTYSPPKSRPVRSTIATGAKPTTTDCERRCATTAGEARHGHTPLTTISTSHSKSPLLSLQEFIAQRRAAVDKSRNGKLSASFASSVPRFENKLDKECL